MKTEKFENVVREVGYYAILIIALLAFRSTFAENYVIPSGSMEPTLKEGDYLFALKCAYGLRVPFTGWRVAKWGQIERGDIVIFPSVENDKTKLIKRVIGLPGDTIQVKQERLYINDVMQPRELYEHHPGLYDLPDASQKNLYVEDLGTVKHFIFQIKNFPSMDNSQIFKVPEGHLFMMGDNRDQSRDSRFFKFVPADSVLGRAGIIYMSMDKSNGFPWRIRHERLGRIVN